LRVWTPERASPGYGLDEINCSKGFKRKTYLRERRQAVNDARDSPLILGMSGDYLGGNRKCRTWGARFNVVVIFNNRQHWDVVVIFVIFVSIVGLFIIFSTLAPPSRTALNLTDTAEAPPSKSDVGSELALHRIIPKEGKYDWEDKYRLILDTVPDPDTLFLASPTS
jgi:hypothetical protein